MTVTKFRHQPYGCDPSWLNEIILKLRLQLKLKEPTDLKFKCQLAVQLKIEYTYIFPSSHSFDSNKSGTPNHQVQYK